MNHEIQHGEHADVCDVCRIPIKHLTHAVTKEYLGKLLTFCSEKCLKQYFDDPALFADFEDDEGLE
jgi:YHS domain-containing protein